MSLQIEVTADVAGAGKQIDDFSKKSRIALNSLSLVAQDLPFGFIGIQNNLPGVISSFGELTREAGGVGGALKQLGSALIGPAGLFLAFSAVTAGVTFLIQKYGSLGAAVTALISNNAKLVQVQNALNKEMASSVGNTAGETAQIQILVKAMSDLSKPMKERQDAYSALKKIAPEIARGIDEENLLTKKNIDLVNENARARIEYIKIRARENAILNIVNKNEQERIALEQEYPALLSKKQKAESAYNKVKGISFDGTKTFNAGLQTEAINLESATNALDKNAAQRRELFKINDGLINQLTPLIEGTAKYDATTKEFTDSLKKQKKEGVKIGTIIDKGELGPGTLLDTEKAFEAYVRGNINIQKAGIERLTRDRNSFRNEIIKDGLLFPKKLDKTAGDLNKNPLIEYQFGQIKQIIDALKEEAKFIDDAFRAPLENLFVDFLQKGKLSFEDFTKSVINNITQLVAKLAASKLFEALASLIPQIAGTLLPGGTELTQIAKFLGSGRSIFGTANFGGVGGGGMNLNGQVVFVQRGTDLVGVMNRTNAQIQRIG
jgi:K+/H+ antiporter YhaU regulatory subunit KhtT